MYKSLVIISFVVFVLFGDFAAATKNIDDTGDTCVLNDKDEEIYNQVTTILNTGEKTKAGALISTKCEEIVQIVGADKTKEFCPCFHGTGKLSKAYDKYILLCGRNNSLTRLNFLMFNFFFFIIN